MKKGYWKPQLQSGTAYDEVNSGLQKMIRRGKEREALILAQEMFDSGFHSAVARRLMIISCEDIGLGNPALVAQVHALCSGFLLAKKDSPSGRVEPLPLIMSIILLARSPKNRECDDSQIVTIARTKSGEDSAAKVISENEEVIRDCHTEHGKSRLAAQAAKTGQSYEVLAMREFLTIGARLMPHVELNGNPWGREARELYGLPPEGPSEESKVRKSEDL
jgi:replication-associated recombination protein RarA